MARHALCGARISAQGSARLRHEWPGQQGIPDMARRLQIGKLLRRGDCSLQNSLIVSRQPGCWRSVCSVRH